MATIYDLPNATHFERGVTGLFEYANTVSEGIFIPIFLAVFWGIIMVGTLGGAKLNATSALLFSTFITGIVAVPLAITGLLGMKWMYLIGFCLALAIFLKTMDRERGF